MLLFFSLGLDDVVEVAKEPPLPPPAVTEGGRAVGAPPLPALHKKQGETETTWITGRSILTNAQTERLQLQRTEEALDAAAHGL